MNYIKNKKITMIILIISVIGLGIGFSLFSSRLSIKSRLSINPNRTFDVKFSKSNTSLDISGYVYPDDQELGVGAVINNDSDPTISELGGVLYEPGQSISYVFYARNMGEYDAYLTDVFFGQNSFISCSPSGATPATQQVTNQVCSSIIVTIEIGENNNKIVLNSNMSQETILTTIGQNYIISKSANPTTGSVNSEKIKVTISYPQESVEADGGISVTFEDIYMTFASVSGFIPELPSDSEDEICLITTTKSFGSGCVYTDDDSSGGISTGDLVTCGTETFNVIKTPSNGRVAMLASYNLNVLDDNPQIVEGGFAINQKYACSTEGYQDEHVIGMFEDVFNPEYSSYGKQTIFDMGGSGGSSSCYGSSCGPFIIYIPYGLVDFWNSSIAELNGYSSGNSSDFFGYWINIEDTTKLDNNFNECSGKDYCFSDGDIQYPVDIYGITNTNGLTSSIAANVNTYVQNLNSQIVGATATGRLITYDELINLGYSKEDTSFTESAQSWVYQTSYWTGSASSPRGIFEVYLNGYMSSDSYDAPLSGVRPVIEISNSVISLVE